MTIEFPKPGVIYGLSDPEHIGRMPVRQEIECLPNLTPNNEWKGADTMPIIAGDLSGMPCKFKSNIAKGSTVMFRGEFGGWYMVDVEKRRNPFAKDKFFVVVSVGCKHKELPLRFTVDGWVVDIRKARQ